MATHRHVAVQCSLHIFTMLFKLDVEKAIKIRKHWYRCIIENHSNFDSNRGISFVGSALDANPHHWINLFEIY